MTTALNAKAQKLLRELPQIRRARDYYLYDSSGNRILDLFQDGGRAWLGHRPEGVSLQLKNTLSRGVYAPYPSPEEGKLLKAARALPKVFGAAEFTEAAYYTGHSPVDAVLWRPGTPWPTSKDLNAAVRPLLPLPGLKAGIILLSKKELHPGDLPSPVLAAALSRTLWSLIGALEKSPNISYPDYASPLWEQDGPYLQYKGAPEAYEEEFRKALSHGILLSPEPELPSILPRVLSPSDLKLTGRHFNGE